MLLTVVTPDASNPSLAIAENTLVFDGQTFVKPEVAQWVMLYAIPVTALSGPYKDQAALELIAEQRMRTFVIDRDPTVEPATDPLVISAEDPSLGVCWCFVTCKGTELRYVVVQPVED